jgi:hypothetical protein
MAGCAAQMVEHLPIISNHKYCQRKEKKLHLKVINTHPATIAPEFNF